MEVHGIPPDDVGHPHPRKLHPAQAADALPDDDRVPAKSGEEAARAWHRAPPDVGGWTRQWGGVRRLGLLVVAPHFDGAR